MNFDDLLEVLDNNLQLEVTVDYVDGKDVYEDNVENFREEELLIDLEVRKIFIKDDCKMCVVLRDVYCY